jgi:uncharacterized protein (DUF2267 family)
MATTTVHTIDTAAQEAHHWVNELADDLGIDRHAALQALRGVLRILRDRLTVDQAAHLSAQLSPLIRGLFFENWDPSRTPTRVRHAEDFADLVSLELTGYPESLDPLDAVVSVFALIARHISPGEVRKIRATMPAEIKSLWPVPDDAE